MKIIVKSKPNSRVEKVELLKQPALDFPNYPADLPVYSVSVKAMAVNGNANKAVIDALAKYFDVAPSLIELVRGKTSKLKTFVINK
jgi:uncharacterized protein YggU (UPF0235/DUF167 family)